MFAFAARLKSGGGRKSTFSRSRRFVLNKSNCRRKNRIALARRRNLLNSAESQVPVTEYKPCALVALSDSPRGRSFYGENFDIGNVNACLLRRDSALRAAVCAAAMDRAEGKKLIKRQI
jgi:hypothetical protein